MTKPKIISKARKDIRPVREGSKKHLILKAALVGITVADIERITGWARSASSSAVKTDLVPLGYLIIRDGDKYTVKLPKGMKRPALR